MLRPLPFPRHLLVSALALSPAWAAAEEAVTLAPVTVADTADSPTDYRTEQVQVTGRDTPLRDTPAAVTVINAAQLADQQARLLSDVLRNDASVGQSYAPIGYYENFIVRGFSLNAASSYKLNGRTITGEQNVALENKEQVELLKGLNGLQSGISEPGGAVNYVTKRPKDVHSVTVGMDDNGGSTLATDLGGFIGADNQLGWRANLAHEELHSYVDHANGQRDFASLALDWNLSERSLLQFDIEYQTREQRSVPGYQLLGGTTLPHSPSRHDLLGYQSWSNPVGIDSLNMVGRYQYQLSDDWQASLSLSRSRVVIDDYSAFPWGFYDDGSYDVYDYRNPDDTRRNDEAEAALNGEFQAMGLRHELRFGVSAFRRIVDQRDALNDYVGTASLGSDPITFDPSTSSASHSYRHSDSRQYSLFASDLIHLDEHWQVQLGGRQVRLDERTFDADGDTTRHTERWVFLPDVALIFKPAEATTLYARYSKGLSLGSAAPWFASNYGQTLAPTESHQLELGIKQDWHGATFGAALFQIRQAYAYSKPNADDTYTYVQQGQQKNIGLELNATGHLSDRWQVAASVAAIRAQVRNSGTPGYDGHQAINTPRLQASLSSDYRLTDQLSLLGGMQYSGAKYADRLGRIEVGSYAVFNAGARYTTRVEGYETVLRLTVDNLFDRRYWRDVGEYQGDDYLFLGAPRTARVSATVNF